MSETTLTDKRLDLRKSVANFARLWRIGADLSADDIEDIDHAINVGVKLACFHPSVRVSDGGTVTSHRWSWLTPTATVTVWDSVATDSGSTVVAGTQTPLSTVTAAGDSVFYDSMIGKTIEFFTNDANETPSGSGIVRAVASSTVLQSENSGVSASTYRWSMDSDGSFRLPDDFGGIDGQCLYFEPGSQDQKIDIIAIGQMLDIFQTTATTGPPKCAATRPVSGTGQSSPQRWELLVWPVPDQVYTLRVPYVRLIDAPDSSLPYLPGGMPYDELFKWACNAAFDREFNDAGEDSVSYQNFMSALSTAVMHDLQAHEPRNLGRAYDMGSRQPRQRTWRSEGQFVTYNGIAIP